MKPKILLYILCLLFLITACRKQEFTYLPEARLGISADSISFDTIFVSTGSTTRQFRIFNENDQKLRLASVRLMSGENSAFQINVDGTPGPSVSDIEIEANDSIHVFVTVQINPDLRDLPFIIRDSIEITYNGNTRKVQLSAWGQNAQFFNNRIITENEIWTNEKPYVITGGLLVAEAATLTIEKGSSVYVQSDAPFIINGTLLVKGEKYDSTRVQFQGDRLDEPYRNFPGAWPGIIFGPESTNSELNYLVIKNAYQGIHIYGSGRQPSLKLNQCIIDNSFDAAITAGRAKLEANNSLFSNNGAGLVLTGAGSYDFEHCTIVSYSNPYILHTKPSLYITNLVTDAGVTAPAEIYARFTNTIVYGAQGTVDNEILLNRLGNQSFQIRFENCLLKTDELMNGVVSANNIMNEDPLFDSIETQKHFYNFRLKENSPAVDAGKHSSLDTDLDGKPRRIRREDIGSYERE